MGWKRLNKVQVWMCLMVWLMALGSSVAQEMPQGLKIAFIGDQGATEGKEKASEVLQLIKNEGADAVVHQGDFDYNHDPEAWDALIDTVLGKEFPYFGSAGNHDIKMWDGYQKVLEERARRIGVSWDGQMGVQSSLQYKGVFVMLIAPDVFETGHADYVREQLAKDNSVWRIGSWHKNQRPMQVGGKSSETGWDVYEEARMGGAIIATGHEHSYSRTYLLSDIANRTVADRSDTLHITRGKTFVFVNGIAGKSMRRIRRLPLGDWWAKAYTLDNGANYGALFGTFGVGGKPEVAEFYFKDIDGRVIDRFTVISHVKRTSSPTSMGDSRLVAAAGSGDLETVKKVLEEGAVVDSRDGSGRTALMEALRRGRGPVAKVLLAAGADIKATDNGGRTVLMYAASGGNLEMVREIVKKGGDVNAEASNGTSALLMAASEENASGVIKTLLELGANAKVTDANGRTPLMIAAAEGSRDNVIALAKKSDVNAKDNEGHNALMLVVYKADAAAAVKALIAAGADVNAMDYEGRTVLMCAADGGLSDAVMQIVKAGARVNAQDEMGRTALMWAAHGRLVPVAKEHRKIVQTLLDAGADRKKKDHQGHTAMTWARYNRNEQIALMVK